MESGTRTITPPGVALDDIVSMTPTEARSVLQAFCTDHGFGPAAQRKAYKLFTKSARQPGKPIIVHTVPEGRQRLTDAMRLAGETHECMEAITSNPITAGLAARAFDLAPGERFDHNVREDRCVLISEVTNAPAA